MKNGIACRRAGRNRRAGILLLALLGLAVSPAVHAQNDLQRGVTFQPKATSNDDKLSDISTQKWMELQAAAQQKWKISKGRDFSKLPPAFQWDKAPTPIDTPFPVYPFDLLSDKVSGRVMVSFAVGPNGLAYGAELQECSAPEFGLAVLAMLDSCRFNPPLKDDKPGYAFLASEYRFNPVGRSDGPVSGSARSILKDLKKNPGEIANLSELDEPLKPLSRPPPVYPSALKKDQPAGSAEVEFFVDTDGHTQLPRIRSSSAPEFGYAVVQAIGKWRFEPPKRGGKPVVVRTSIPIEFAGKAAAPGR